MIAKLILDKKREGHALGSAEIREFIEGFTKGEIPDYQMSALAPACRYRAVATYANDPVETPPLVRADFDEIYATSPSCRTRLCFDSPGDDASQLKN